MAESNIKTAAASSAADAYETWFLSQQGIPYDGMHAFARAAYMHALAAAPAQAVAPKAIFLSAMQDNGGEQPAYCVMAVYRSEADARSVMSLLSAAARPADVVPAQSVSVEPKRQALVKGSAL